jgi:hypothetical protein
VTGADVLGEIIGPYGAPAPSTNGYRKRS